MRRKKVKHSGAGWSWRLGGLALIAFFTLGYLSGLRAPRTAFARRVLGACDHYRARVLDAAALVRHLPTPRARRSFHAGDLTGSVAMVERSDGFYTLSESGELRGPVSSGAEDNLPIMSGAPLETASARALIDYASVLVRAEAQLSQLISEMRLAGDGEASLFLDRSRTELVLDLDRAAFELPRAARVLQRWRGREAEIATLDMTTPGQAVMRLRPAPISSAKRRTPEKVGKLALAKVPARSFKQDAALVAAAPRKTHTWSVIEADLR